MVWLDVLLIILMLIGVVLGIVVLVLSAQADDVSIGIGLMLLIIGSGIMIFSIPMIRFDFASGSTTGIVTSVDGSMWGNKYIYIKTTETNEERYCIDKNNTELLKNVDNYVGKQIKITYGKMVGFHSISQCPNAPIETIVELDVKINE